MQFLHKTLGKNPLIFTKPIWRSCSMLILFWVGTQSAFSQIDTTYIGKFENEYSYRAYVGRRFTSLAYEYSEGDRVDNYMPNNPVGVGVGFAWKGFGLNVGYGFNFLRDPKKGRTRSLDLQYHYYGRKMVFDFFGQNYRGLYLSNNDKNSAVKVFPDIKLIQFGVFGQYVFNGNKFSYRAAFDQSERQLKSAGSLLVGGGLYYNSVRSDGSIEFSKSDYQFGPNVGYAYTAVIRKRFFASGSITVGGNMSIEERRRTKPELHPTTLFRGSLGYSAETWSANLAYVSNKVYVSNSTKEQISLETGTFQLTFVKRFDSNSKFLKRLSNLTSED